MTLRPRRARGRAAADRSGAGVGTVHASLLRRISHRPSSQESPPPRQVLPRLEWSAWQWLTSAGLGDHHGGVVHVLAVLDVVIA